MSHRPTPALVISIVALFVAMGGTGYAASQIPRASVGAAQLKKNAVSSPKVKNGSLALNDFKVAEHAKLRGSAGARGAAGARGSQGLGGIRGLSGLEGDEGAEGSDGGQGIQGIPGPTGVEQVVVRTGGLVFSAGAGGDGQVSDDGCSVSGGRERGRRRYRHLSYGRCREPAQHDHHRKQTSRPSRDPSLQLEPSRPAGSFKPVATHRPRVRRSTFSSSAPRLGA